MSVLLTLNTGNDGRDYDSFLREKVRFDRSYGFTVPDEALSPIFQPEHPLYRPHQAAIVHWAVEGGRRAIFARYGLGKSVMQLEVLRLIVEHATDHGTPDAFGRLVRRGLVVVDLNHDDYEAVATVLTALNDVSKTGGYVTTFEVAEVDADGEVKRVMVSL